MNYLHEKNRKPEKAKLHRKLPKVSTARSSFTNGELETVYNIFRRVTAFPICPNCETEKMILFSLTGSGVLARCSVCGFEAVSSGSSWPGVETMKVESKRRRMY
jgi:hypothetical protein